MTGEVATDVDPWPDLLAGAGLLVCDHLGTGMDGAVYAVDDATVVKVWHHRPAAELALLADFLADLAASGLSFATPEIAAVVLVADRAVTVERRLAGKPLPDYSEAADPPSEAALRAFVEVLAALREVRATPAMRAIGVLDSSTAYSAPDQTFPAMLLQLLERRVQTYGDQLACAVDGFAPLLDGVRSGLRSLPTEPDGDRVIHGDLCPPNLLLDGVRVVGVVDWGFLSTAGDPAFDAALATSFFDMYGGHARATEDTLTDRVIEVFGYPRERLQLYRAAYAILGAHAYSADGGDGHFAWCAERLRRPDLRTALGIAPVAG